MNIIHHQVCQECRFDPYGFFCSFNPCFNGFFFSIWLCRNFRNPALLVSILVLMDSSFQYLIRIISNGSRYVSILVLMDSSFQSQNTIKGMADYASFNPCFNGFFFSIVCNDYTIFFYECFNPCFNGFFFSIRPGDTQRHYLRQFQSLF